jgi:hypothetical protein
MPQEVLSEYFHGAFKSNWKEVMKFSENFFGATLKDAIEKFA